MLRKIINGIRNLFRGKPAEQENRKQPQKKQNRKNQRPLKKRQNRPQRNEKKNVQQPKERRVLNKKVTVPLPPPMPELMDIPAEEGKVRFQDLALAKEVIAGTQQLGFKYCSVIQEKALPHAIDGRDLAAKAQTGTGKTAAFLASSMTRLLAKPKESRRPKTCRVLVLEPTRELALQIEKDAEAIGKYTGLYSKAIFGGIDYKEQKNAIDIPVDILACTPGRMLDYARSGALDLSETEILVIDEADRMLDMGFIPDVRRIVGMLPPAGKRQTMLFSATLEPEILRLADRWLVDPVSVEAEPEHVVTDLIDQRFYAVLGSQKIAMLLWLLKNEPYDRMIIFGNWKHRNAELTEELRSYGVECEMLSGDIPQNKRIRILDAFKEGKCRIIVATDVAARGIHVDGISHVINFDLPEQAEDYVHRIGRTGRAGKKGTAISFVCEFGAFNLPEIEKYAEMEVKSIQPEEECFILPERVKSLKEVKEDRPVKKGGSRPFGGRPHLRRRY
ncbi:MAG: DEAD/DEAH box helicase [Lentisphaeria bacterium]|nr:DEAD/DEAH box helicase [Lentisphaeria bacterium]